MASIEPIYLDTSVDSSWSNWVREGLDWFRFSPQVTHHVTYENSELVVESLTNDEESFLKTALRVASYIFLIYPIIYLLGEYLRKVHIEPLKFSKIIEPLSNNKGKIKGKITYFGSFYYKKDHRITSKVVELKNGNKITLEGEFSNGYMTQGTFTSEKHYERKVKKGKFKYHSEDNSSELIDGTWSEYSSYANNGWNHFVTFYVCPTLEWKKKQGPPYRFNIGTYTKLDKQQEKVFLVSDIVIGNQQRYINANCSNIEFALLIIDKQIDCFESIEELTNTIWPNEGDRTTAKAKLSQELLLPKEAGGAPLIESLSEANRAIVKSWRES